MASNPWSIDHPGWSFGTVGLRSRSRPPALIGGEAVLAARQLRIRPTRRGLGMALTLLLLLLMAFIYNNNLVYALAFLLASVGCVALLHAVRNVLGLTVRIGAIPAVFAGQSTTVTVHIGAGARSAGAGLELSLANEVQPTGADGVSERTTLVWPLARRGWHRLPPLIVTSRFPLGVFRVSATLNFDAGGWAYPKPADADLPFPDQAGGLAAGRRAAEALAADDFNGIREYQPGDSPRRIHWQAYAKGQGLYSKLYANHRGGEALWLSLDQAPGLALEDRLGQLCRWLLDAEAGGMRYGLRLPRVTIAPERGAAHRQRCLQALAEV